MEEYLELTEGFKILHPNSDTPERDQSFSFPQLFNVDKNNKRRIWWASYSLELNESLVLTGLETSLRIFTDEIKAKGKKTTTEQAFQILKNKYNDKILSGYRDDVESFTSEFPLMNKINTKDSSIQLTEPMLAKDFVLKEDKKGKIKSNVTSFPVFVQPKLDGIRLLSNLNDQDKVILSSRRSRSFNYSENHFKNIKKELKIILKQLPDNSILDGELYSHGLLFTDICSIVKTKNEVHEDIEKIRYYIFDIVIFNLNYEDRFQLLLERFEENDFEYIQLIQTEVADSFEEIEELMNQLIDEGYEGLMIKKLGAGTGYFQGRTSNLLKYKLVKEEEITVTDVIECQGNERGLCKIVGVLDSGQTVTVRPSCNFELRREYLQNRDELIGKRYTIIYNDVNQKTGVPRFPRGKGFRDYE
jgi:hypothetical protein